MAENFGSPNPIQPLSVGNVVSAGIRLYRSHFKDYFLLALKAYVWVLLPVYGWAKFSALTALISRLAFGELVNQPESVSSGQRFVNSRLWQFLLAMLLLFLIGIGVALGVLIIFTLASLVSAAFVGGIGQPNNPAIVLVFVLFSIALGIVALLAVVWLMTHFYLVDLPLAVEDGIEATSAISRSWELTQGHIWRIFLISFVGVLITIPIQIVLQIVITIVQAIFLPLINEGNSLFALLYFVIVLALSFSSGALLIPFWQSIKAVVYYDLRSRREGLGLKLRDNEI